MIFTKSSFSKKMRKTFDFGVVFGGQNDEKSRKNGVEKRIFFQLRFFHVFLRFFGILARFWEARGPQKIEKNWKNSKKIDFLTRSFLKGGSGRVLEGFWDGFERILNGFSGDFGKILGRIWREKIEIITSKILTIYILLLFLVFFYL